MAFSFCTSIKNVEHCKVNFAHALSHTFRWCENTWNICSVAIEICISWNGMQTRGPGICKHIRVQTINQFGKATLFCCCFTTVEIQQCVNENRKLEWEWKCVCFELFAVKLSQNKFAHWVGSQYGRIRVLCSYLAFNLESVLICRPHAWKP